MKRLLHVTDVLPKPAYQCDPWYLERGKAVHLACQLDNDGTLDDASLDPRIIGYVEAWRKCKREAGIVVVASEVRVEGLGYIGTADVVGRMLRRTLVGDIKCGVPEPWHPLQLAAYREPLGVKDRYGIHLHEDETYKLIEYTGKDDLRVFMAKLTSAYWDIEHGLREWPERR